MTSYSWWKKHLLVKKNKAKESVLNSDIDIKYCPTSAMRADLGTKPLSYRSIMVHLDDIGLMEVSRINGLYTLRRLGIPALKVRSTKENNREPTNRPKSIISKRIENVVRKR